MQFIVLTSCPVTPQECDFELVDLIRVRAALLRRQRRGEVGLQVNLDRLADCIAYTDALWARNPWPRYFQPYGGAIHVRPVCQGLKRPAPLVPRLSGMSRDAVASFGRRCRHCL